LLSSVADKTDNLLHSSDAYYPFSAGKHSCVGINFAWHEMRVVLANILSRMDVQEVAGQTVDFRQ
jgi:cytochrome P450